MDIRLPDAPATAAEREAVAEILGPQVEDAAASRVARGGHAARDRRHLLLPGLHALQRRAGWISPGGLTHLCERLGVPPADAYGVATFYALLSTEPRPGTVVHVCDDVACIPAGAESLVGDLVRRFGPEHGDGDVRWQRSPCLGLCDRAPAAFVQRSGSQVVDAVVAPADDEGVVGVVGGVTPTTALVPVPSLVTTDDAPSLVRRIGRVDPTSLEAYREAGGLLALERARDLGPEGVIAEIREARLLGRGGAAFPTADKWDAVRRRPAGPRIVICNADESEPGTFKDRTILEGDPFAVVEALAIAALATGADRGFIYLRGEYPVAERRVLGAIDALRRAGVLGCDATGGAPAFDVELRRGAGAYICGEETALFASLEGYRGEPRSKPPFPVERGAFGLPTAVNNVETLANVPEILRLGGAAYARTGTAASTGTRLFCVSGCVGRPGTYEVPCGTTLRDLLAEAGGVRGGADVRAILLGGASGSFVTADALDMALSFESAREAGVTLGSGVVVVFDASVDMTAVVRRIARFFRDESCGQCVPCRIGTVRQEESLARVVRGADAATEIPLLRDVGLAMKDASICGLGQTASAAVLSAFELGLVGGVRR